MRDAQIEGWVNRQHPNPVSALQLHGPMITDSCASGSLSVDKDGRSDNQGRIPDMRTELGSYCVRGAPQGFSRTEHIMSRYRPIAPKPIVMKPGESAGSAPSDPHSSSTLSFERTSTKANSFSSDSSRRKRTRKRGGAESLPSPRVSKRSSLLPGRVDRPRTASCKSIAVIGGIEKAVEQFYPDNVANAGPSGGPSIAAGGYLNLKESAPTSYLTEVAPADTPPMFAVPGHTRFDRDKYGSSFGAIGRKNPRPQLVVDSRGCPVGLDVASKVDALADRCVTSVPPMERESAFMERAAAGTPASSGRRLNCLQKANNVPGEYTHHLRVAYGSAHRAYGSDTGPVVDDSRKSLLMEGSLFPAHPSLSTSLGESEVSSGEVADSRKTNLVTLSLLPDTPSLEQTSSEVSVPKSHFPSLQLAMGIDPGSWEVDGQNEGTEELHKLTLFSRSGAGAEEDAKRKTSVEGEREREREKDREGSWGRRNYASDSHPVDGRPLPDTFDKDLSASACDPDEKKEPGKVHVIDMFYMEQGYSLSSDPILLTDENSYPLWSNPAYKRASTERTSCKDKDVVGPYIDPLGIPHRNSVFWYLTPQGTRVRAVMWGFLKKFMLKNNAGCLLSEENDVEYRNGMTEQKFIPNVTGDGGELGAANQHTVIAPQPIRPVGSTLTVGTITRNNVLSSPLADSLESLKEQLENTPMPAIITDYRNRVRYMNAAYKQMVGQPECLWLTTVGKKTVWDTAQLSRLTGEVRLTCDENLDQLAPAFSCKVQVRWNNQGKESTMTVSCDVNRLDSDRVGPMYVWKLDVPSIGLRPHGGVLRQDCAQGK